MTRTELINGLMITNKFKNYLEIGMQKSANNFDKIIAAVKVSVDPDPNAEAMYPETSDSFFNLYIPLLYHETHPMPYFDLVFIDGLHHAEQVERDIINSMRVLNPGGYIVLHDCNPKEEWQQLVPRQHKIWYGDVWRAFAGFRKKYPNYISFCLDHDCGLGVICKAGSYEKIEPGFVTDMPWQEFDKNRKQLLGII